MCFISYHSLNSHSQSKNTLCYLISLNLARLRDTWQARNTVSGCGRDGVCGEDWLTQDWFEYGSTIQCVGHMVEIKRGRKRKSVIQDVFYFCFTPALLWRAFPLACPFPPCYLFITRVLKVKLASYAPNKLILWVMFSLTYYHNIENID